MADKKILIAEWYCYMCGKKVGEEFYLWSMNDSTDRVFLGCSSGCMKLADDPMYIIKVKRLIE